MIYLKTPDGKEYSAKQYAYTGGIATLKNGKEDNCRNWSSVKYLVNQVEILSNSKQINKIAEEGKKNSDRFLSLAEEAKKLSAEISLLKPYPIWRS